ncbi:hypothetical protein [Sphingobacterium sp.]|uniref:hypothetical protein n=1 Tax=Sphingobacterium sp. TaxID=341027 RepID=UPI0028A0D071|nr:hypothetical protein [Sphingobacterium sp.]
MEFKGTRGIWRMCISDDGDLVSDVKHLAPSKIVCQIHKHKSIEGRANSLLISKAPEMLEMLKEANKVIEWYMDNAKPDDNHTDFFNIGMNQRTQIQELIQSATTI